MKNVDFIASTSECAEFFLYSVATKFDTKLSNKDDLYTGIVRTFKSIFLNSAVYHANDNCHPSTYNRKVICSFQYIM
jgi:hypothetical protein